MFFFLVMYVRNPEVNRSGFANFITTDNPYLLINHLAVSNLDYTLVNWKIITESEFNLLNESVDQLTIKNS